MKIALAGWSLNRRFRAQQEPMLLLEFPSVARHDFGITAIEVNSPFFVSRDKRYLTELDDIAVGEGVDLINIAVDGMGDLCDVDKDTRERAIENNAAWLPVAAHLGCSSIRVNTGGYNVENEDDAMLWCIDAFLELAQRGSREGVMVLIENRGGLSDDPDKIVKIIEAVDSPWIGTLPDFGNFPPEVNRQQALEKLMPYAGGLRAKMREFNEAGLETTIDIPRCIQIARKHGYDGYVCIAYEGEEDERDAIRAGKALLEKCIAEKMKIEPPVKGIAKNIPVLKSLRFPRVHGDRRSGS